MKKTKLDRKILIIKAISKVLIALICVFLFTACGKDTSNEEVMVEDSITENALEDLQENDSQAELEAKEIIAKAESYNTTDNLFSYDAYKENPSEFFLNTDDSDAYNLILDDLSQKTNSAQEQVINFYANVDSLFSDEDVLADMVFSYYRNLTIDSNKAYEHTNTLTGKKFISDENICVAELILYVPYYLYQCESEDKVLAMSSVVDEMSNYAVKDLFWYGFEETTVNYLVNSTPYYESLAVFGMKYEDLSGISKHELVFSTPIEIAGDEVISYEWVTGKTESSYIVPVWDKTSNIYGAVYFDSDNQLLVINYD